MVTANAALFRVAFIKVDCIFYLSSLSFVYVKDRRINQHHHQHSAWEYVVGGDFALVMRVPHERVSSFRGGRVDHSACWRDGARADRIGCGVWPEIRRSAVPCSV